MKIKSFLIRLLFDATVIGVMVLLVAPLTSHHSDLAIADEFANAEESSVGYPYTHTFTISAYYSPLPCQQRYHMGSYEAEIRMNGSGVRGADGTSVFPGMVAAPKTYAFGTKMHIPGVGIVSVHDRGGAIVASNGANGVYDRLDVWMGYGDKGLERALSWGKRTVNVVVYGQNDSLSEQIELDNYSPEEAKADQCSSGYSAPEPQATDVDTQVDGTAPEVAADSKSTAALSLHTRDLAFGDNGSHVSELQEELVRLNYYRGPITGYYGEVTEHAVFKFQQSLGIVTQKADNGAGIFGPKTREIVVQIVADRNSSRQLIAQTTESFNSSYVADLEGKVFLAGELQFGMSGPEVEKLQFFLKKTGYLNADTTQYFGYQTKDAVLRFQFDKKIIASEADRGAGRVGPSTLRVINDLA